MDNGTEEEAEIRKAQLYKKALMSLTPEQLAFKIRANFAYEQQVTLQEISRDSILEKPRQVKKMSYCSFKDDKRLLRQASTCDSLTTPEPAMRKSPKKSLVH